MQFKEPGHARARVGGETLSSTTISQPEIATRSRRKNLKKTWTSKEWKAARLAFIKERGGKCEMCGYDKYLTVHHPFRNVYGKDAYDDFYLSGCILLCRSCHSATHAGMTLCKRDHPDGEKHYRYHDAEMCSYCYKLLHPEIKELQEIRKIRAKKKKKLLEKQQKEKYKNKRIIKKPDKFINGGTN